MPIRAHRQSVVINLSGSLVDGGSDALRCRCPEALLNLIPKSSFGPAGLVAGGKN